MGERGRDGWSPGQNALAASFSSRLTSMLLSILVNVSGPLDITNADNQPPLPALFAFPGIYGEMAV